MSDNILVQTSVDANASDLFIADASFLIAKFFNPEARYKKFSDSGALIGEDDDEFLQAVMEKKHFVARAKDLARGKAFHVNFKSNMRRENRHTTREFQELYRRLGLDYLDNQAQNMKILALMLYHIVAAIFELGWGAGSGFGSALLPNSGTSKVPLLSILKSGLSRGNAAEAASEVSFRTALCLSGGIHGSFTHPLVPDYYEDGTTIGRDADMESRFGFSMAKFGSLIQGGLSVFTENVPLLGVTAEGAAITGVKRLLQYVDVSEAYQGEEPRVYHDNYVLMIGDRGNLLFLNVSMCGTERQKTLALNLHVDPTMGGNLLEAMSGIHMCLYGAGWEMEPTPFILEQGGIASGRFILHMFPPNPSAILSDPTVQFTDFLQRLRKDYVAFLHSIFSQLNAIANDQRVTVISPYGGRSPVNLMSCMGVLINIFFGESQDYTRGLAKIRTRILTKDLLVDLFKTACILNAYDIGENEAHRVELIKKIPEYISCMISEHAGIEGFREILMDLVRSLYELSKIFEFLRQLNGDTGIILNSKLKDLITHRRHFTETGGRSRLNADIERYFSDVSDEFVNAIKMVTPEIALSDKFGAAVDDLFMTEADRILTNLHI